MAKKMSPLDIMNTMGAAADKKSKGPIAPEAEDEATKSAKAAAKPKKPFPPKFAAKAPK